MLITTITMKWTVLYPNETLFILCFFNKQKASYVTLPLIKFVYEPFKVGTLDSIVFHKQGGK